MENVKIVLVLGDNVKCNNIYKASEGERVHRTFFEVFDGKEPTEFSRMIRLLFDFHRVYNDFIHEAYVNNKSCDRYIANPNDMKPGQIPLTEKDKYDTIVFSCNIMQALKKNNTLKPKKFNDMMSLGYKLLKMDGFIRPDEIYYISDRGEIDTYCAYNTWEVSSGDVKVIDYKEDF